jgi:glycosyltransferase involved in cell wall biosynthesis
MKVLVTHEMFPPDFGGGGEYVVLRMVSGLRSAGVDARVLTAGDPKLTDYEGIPTTRLPISRYRFNLAVRSIIDHARDVDIIQTYAYHACLPSLIAGRILKKPVVCYMLAYYQDIWRKVSPPLIGRLRASWEHYLVMRGYARIIFPSRHALNAALAAGVSPERATFNCPSIDLDQYAPALRKEDVVLFAGKLDPRKGIDDVLAVAQALPRIRFRIMGFGPEEERVRQASSPNVEFIEFKRGKPLRDAFASARIFLSPSMGETFGLSVLEAMASGCAVISSAPLEFEGFRVRHGDRSAMISAVEALHSNREMVSRMGASNIERARKFSWTEHTRVLLDIYSACCPC